MTTTLPPLANLCRQCSVLELDDSDVPGAYAARSDTGEVCLAAPEQHPDQFSLKLDYFVLDSLPGLPCLAQSACGGCDFCAIVKSAIERHARGSFDQVLVYLFFQWYRPCEDEPPVRLRSLIAELLWIGYDEDGNHLSLSTWLRFDIDAPPGGCAQWLGIQPPPRDDALCAENLQTISKGIERSNHIRISLNGATYPTRLIDVGAKGSNFCRLVETKADPAFAQSSDIQYATLSYCWGPPEDSSRQFKTETSSFQKRTVGFGIDQASPILRDAVRVAQTLGIRYLWVDAVCIIQDDKQDWYKESSQISLIFQNSALTICSPASTSCQEGFLNRNWTTTRIRFQSRINRAVSGSYTLRLVGEVKDYFHATSDGLSLALTHSSWATRGWILQEYELSQRALVFTKTNLHVITEHGVQSEADETIDISERTRGASFLPGSRNELNKYLNFLSLVEDYSAMKLTHRSDKFPAISGLASRLYNGGGYYAGHILPHIDLLWTSVLCQPVDRITREALVETLKSQDPYVAPSWSWASRNHAVTFGDGRLRLVSQELDFPKIRAECHVVEAKTSITGVDLFSGIQDGELTLHSVVVPLITQTELQGTENGMFVQLLAGVDGNSKVCRLIEAGQYIADLSFDWNEMDAGETFDDLSLVLIGSRDTKGLSWEPIKLIYEHELLDEAEEKLVEERDTSMSNFIVRGRPDAASLRGKRVFYRVHHCRGCDGDDNENDEDHMTEDRLICDPCQNHKIGITHGKVVDAEREYQRHVSEVYEGQRRLSRHSDSDSDDDDGDDDNRYAYGIIVQPVPSSGKYFRVGVFLSVPRERGGLKYFRDKPKRNVEIV
ncbi:HET-domain-containing protein [Daldinia caldariorum]|uniref:HET-domain-containing protein n=1 Tax=Daldinia caldariorum TaxID=326644 RepID=UPI0020083C3F|nr:HET-domain-containing protein [Daldinia caldariorum]KAI1471764.1 HET-domain-containing protein [Daldinia caldariorum]